MSETSVNWPFIDDYVAVCKCGNVFHGPKRAPCCWKCLSDQDKLWWLSQGGKV